MSQGQWTTPNTGFLDKLRAMAADREELPPDPGTVPVPEGHVRLWHYTPLENVPSIREHGLQRRFARGDAGNGDLTDPSAGMWASTYPPEHLNHSDGHAAVVEFHAHPSEISGNAESPWMAENKREPGQSWEDRTWDSGKLREWNAGHHHVIMRGSVPPEHILAIHEPWHHAARYMRKDDPTLQSYQWVKDDYAKGGNDHLEPYVRGLRALEGSYVPPREYSAGRMRVSDIRRPGEGRLSERPYTQDELADDIRANGVQQPLAIEHLPAHGGPTTFNGLHRLDAAERAGVPDVPVVVKHLPGDYPPMTGRRAATEAEFNAAYDLERSGRWAGEREASLIGHFEAAEDTSYRGQHQGPDEDDGEAMHEVGSGKVYPKDFHEHPEWYIESDGPGNWDSYDKVRRSKDWPSRRVTMYRSMPSPHREVNPGDWVTSSPAYARLHGKQSNPDDDWPVVKFEARADQLRTAGDSINEWSYHGPRISRALVHFSGGKNHRGRGPRGGKSDAALYEHEPPEMYQAYEAQNAERRRRKREEREGRERESARKEASMRSFAVLTNPHTGGHDWYHGSPYSFGAGEFSAHSASPLEYEQDPYDSSHWNSLIGSHFAASHRMAEEFSKGEHGNDMGHGEEGPARNVLHARLELKHPKVYASEHDMDQEAYEHEWRAGNHHDNYHDPDELAEAKEYGAEDELPRTYRYAGHGDRLRAQSEADPEYAAMGHYHPYATGWLNAHPDKWNIAQRHRQRLIDAGHDSIVYGNEFEKHHGTADQHHVCAIPFHGGQVDVTQRHTGEHCIDPESAARQWPGRSQPMLPGFDKEGALDVVAHFEPRTAAGPYLQQKLFHMQPDPTRHEPASMRHNPEDPEAGYRYRKEHDEDYQPDECPECGGDRHFRERHDDEHRAYLDDQDWYTDWEGMDMPSHIHRGMAVHLPQELHDFVHDESRPAAHRAAALASHLVGHPSSDSENGLGHYWSESPDQSKGYAEGRPSWLRPGAGEARERTPVMVHAHFPGREHIETDPETLRHWKVLKYGYARDNLEYPISEGAPIRLSGISWARPDHRHHDVDFPLHKDEAWTHHEFGGEGIQANASLATAAFEDDEDDREARNRFIHPEAACPHCGEPAHGEKGADPLRFNLDGPDSPPVPSSIARCNNCGETYPAHHSAEQARVDREAAEMNHAEYEKGRIEGEELFRHFTPHPTHPMIGWDGARDLVNKWRREEQQFGGPGAVVLPQDNPMARQIRLHRFHRVLNDPDASRPVELPRPEEDITRMSALTGGPQDPEGMWRHLQEMHGVKGEGNRVPGTAFMNSLHDRFHAGQTADSRRVQHQHDETGAISHARDSAPSLHFTPVPPEELEAQRKAREPKPERLDDREYSIRDVSRRYDWEGFDHHEIAHLVHDPEHAVFTKEGVPVHSLRYDSGDGNLRPVHTYEEIAGQDEDEQNRLHELERGIDNDEPVPPIVTVRDGEHHIIADGSHRAAIYARQRRTHIPAFVTQRTIYPGQHIASATAAYDWETDEGPFEWHEIAQRHPHIYGEGNDDAEGIADAAAHLYHDRPGHPYEETYGELHPAWSDSGGMVFHPRTVDPSRIDYHRSDPGDGRVRHAREGYESQQPEKVPPLILVHRHGVFQVADGHHRSEGADKAHKPVRAYVAYSPYEDKPYSDGERAPYHGAEAQERPALPDQNGVRRPISYPGFPHTTERPRPMTHEAALDVTAHFDLGGHAPEGELSDHLRRLHGYDQDALDWAAHRPAHRRYEDNPTGNLEDVHRTEHHVRGGGYSASNEHEPVEFTGLPSEEERRSADDAMAGRVQRATRRDSADRVRRHHVPGFYEDLHGADYPFREPQRPDSEENPGDGTSSWKDAADYTAHHGPIDPVFGSASGRELVAHFGERGPATPDLAARDTVLAPAGIFSPVLDAITALGAWEPQSTAEAARGAAELEEVFEAFREGLRHVLLMLEDMPLDPDAADALHEVLRCAAALEADFPRIARMLPPEASWEEPGHPNH